MHQIKEGEPIILNDGTIAEVKSDECDTSIEIMARDGSWTKDINYDELVMVNATIRVSHDSKADLYDIKDIYKKHTGYNIMNDIKDPETADRSRHLFFDNNNIGCDFEYGGSDGVKKIMLTGSGTLKQFSEWVNFNFDSKYYFSNRDFTSVWRGSNLFIS